MPRDLPSVLLVLRDDPAQRSAAAKLAQAGFEVMAASPAEFATRILATLSFDAIIIDGDPGKSAVALMERSAAISPDTRRIVIGGDACHMERLCQSEVSHHYFPTLDIDALIPLLRAEPKQSRAPRSGWPWSKRGAK